MTHSIKIAWTDADAPISLGYDDVYYSNADGLAEARHVFLENGALARRWSQSAKFRAAELGFGVGLNFCATLAAWRQTAPPQAQLEYYAIEIAPPPKDVILRALGRWPELTPLAEELADQWPPAPGWSKLAFGSVTLHLGFTAAQVLLERPGEGPSQIDAWHLDGFNPAKNPDMWSAELMAEICARTKPGGGFATYAAAGWVRRNLQAAGFDVTRTPGFGRKREMLRGVKPA